MLDRETLGQVVRAAWIAWAREQPNPKPSWLVPWEELSAADKEADRRIGDAVRLAVWEEMADGMHRWLVINFRFRDAQ